MQDLQSAGQIALIHAMPFCAIRGYARFLIQKLLLLFLQLLLEVFGPLPEKITLVAGLGGIKSSSARTAQIGRDGRIGRTPHTYDPLHSRGRPRRLEPNTAQPLHKHHLPPTHTLIVFPNCGTGIKISQPSPFSNSPHKREQARRGEDGDNHACFVRQ